jgi:hypothetical protein
MLVCWFALSLWLVSSRADGGQAEPAQTPVFLAGEGGYHTYRIPSLIVSPRGTLLAFCEGRKSSPATPATSTWSSSAASTAAKPGGPCRSSGTTVPTPAAIPARSWTAPPA